MHRSLARNSHYPKLVEFSALVLPAQHMMVIALTSADLNDHEQLRHDPLFALLSGRRDITGKDRRDPKDKGVPLAGKSTLNWLELTPVGASEDSRYKKTVASIAGLQDALVDVFMRLRAKQGVPKDSTEWRLLTRCQIGHRLPNRRSSPAIPRPSLTIRRSSKAAFRSPTENGFLRMLHQPASVATKF